MSQQVDHAIATDHRIRDNLVQARPDQDVAYSIFPLEPGVHLRFRQRPNRNCAGNRVVADHAQHFFYQVGALYNIRVKGWHGYLHAVTVLIGDNDETQPRQGFHNFMLRHLDCR